MSGEYADKSAQNVKVKYTSPPTMATQGELHSYDANDL